MLIPLLLFIIIIAYFLIPRDGATGSAELVENKTLLKHKAKHLGYADFESFLDKKKISNRLVCIVGADLSGRTHLAKLISRKFGHKLISKDHRDIPALRKEFYIEGVKKDATVSQNNKIKEEIAKQKKNKFVIEGKFNNEDLSRLFKGKGYNRNFLLLVIQPKDGAAMRWSKLTGKNKSEYDNVLKETKSVISGINKYRYYIINNSFAN